MSDVPKYYAHSVAKKSTQSDGTLLNEHHHVPKIEDRTSPTKQTLKFGNLLEVPNSDRGGLASHSTSVSTDEGIAMDDPSQPIPTECHAIAESAGMPEAPIYCGLPDLFCSRCYCTLGPTSRGSVFALTQLSDPPTRQLHRMRSEEVGLPRTRQPTVGSAFSQSPLTGSGHYRRRKFEERGHSMSDAQVMYHPMSSDFAGVHAHRRVRRLPRTPTKDDSPRRFLYDRSTTANSSRRESRCDGSLKPPLLRQTKQCQESFEEKAQSISPSDQPRERKRQSLLSDFENTESTRRLMNDGTTNSETLKKRHHSRAKSMDYTPDRLSHTATTPLKTYMRSATIGEKTTRTPQRSPKLRSRPDSEKSVNEPEPKSRETIRNIEAVSNSENNDNETVQQSPPSQKSIAEKLMSADPVDPRRVQGIVQDVLFGMGEERILQYKDAFAKFDKDSSGIISSKQLRRLMRTLGHNPGDDELRQLVNQVDMDENGKIDFNEFIVLVGHFDKANNTSEDLSHIFRVYDEKHGGNIDVGELRAICSEYLTGTVDPEYMNEMINFIDLDGDGEINREELCRVWSNRW